LREQDFLTRLRKKDPSLWSQDPRDQAIIQNRLGWVTVHRSIQASIGEMLEVAGWVRELDFQRVVLIGMGGSSLAPEVFQSTFGAAPGFPELIVLDSTDPMAVARVENRIEIETTLFIISSKSGTTIETASLQRYFEERMWDATGDIASLDNFIAITDPDTPLHHQAIEDGYHKVFVNPPDIGGRYSALSFFGLVPAAAIGVDVERLLRETEALDWEEAVELGARLGDLALQGRDKVTFLHGNGLESFGAWAEQLLAESTGKQGEGLIPVDGEPIGALSAYGEDRVFVYLDAGERSSATQQALERLKAAGHPVIATRIDDPYELGREFLCWEVATAAAGAVLGINPFDEPNVQESKDNTRRVLEGYVRSGRMPQGEPDASEDSLDLHLTRPAAESLREVNDRTIAVLVAAHLGNGAPPHYAAVMAYIAPAEEHDRLLTRLRVAVRDATTMATTVGYGPRFLHSTGQLHKGGPATGIFLQITTDDATDEDIPGETGFGFSALKQAQALGDLEALGSRGLPVVRVHLRGDTTSSLRRLVDTVEAALVPLSVAGRE
jgi:glucose-6-phosphate isomerase